MEYWVVLCVYMYIAVEQTIIFAAFMFYIYLVIKPGIFTYKLF